MFLTQRAGDTTYTLLLRGGYQLSYYTAENLGFVQYYTVLGAVTHRLMDKTTVGLSGSVEWDKYKLGTLGLTNADQKDTIWTLNGNVAYALLKWLNLSLNLSYQENHSNISTGDYTEFRSLVRAEARYF